jgi:hypothetical protein
MKLITEYFDKNLSSQKKDNSYYIEGIFLQADVVNKNGRIYPMSILSEEVDKYVQDFVLTNRALGELNHPKTPKVNPERASHMITELKQDGNSNFYGKAKVLSKMPCGSVVANLIDEGVKFGVSSRGLGELEEQNGNKVCISYNLSAIDIVYEPSAPLAFVNGILEDKEWIYCKGQITEQTIDDYKKKIAKSTKNQRSEGLFLNLFENYLNKL